MPFVTLVSLLLLGGVVGLLLFNTSMQQASFAATALEEQATTLSAREQTLQMELERLRDPQRVAEAAQRHGHGPRWHPAFLDLGTGKVPATWRRLPPRATPDHRAPADPAARARSGPDPAQDARRVGTTLDGAGTQQGPHGGAKVGAARRAAAAPTGPGELAADE